MGAVAGSNSQKKLPGSTKHSLEPLLPIMEREVQRGKKGSGVKGRGRGQGLGQVSVT